MTEKSIRLNNGDKVSMKIGDIDLNLTYDEAESRCVLTAGDELEIIIDATPDQSLFTNVKFSKSSGYSGFSEIDKTPEGTIVKVEYDENGVAKEINIVK